MKLTLFAVLSPNGYKFFLMNLTLALFCLFIFLSLIKQSVKKVYDLHSALREFI